MEWIVCLLVLAIVICVPSIWYSSTKFHKVYYRLSSEKISKPVKFVLLSDLHNKSYGSNNEQLIEAVKAEKPDAILIAGDMITGKPPFAWTAVEALCSSLAKQFPVYYALGNHEARLLWKENKYPGVYEQYMEYLKDLGITVLSDASKDMKDFPIRIYGLGQEKKYYKRFCKTPMQDEYLTEHLGTKDDAFYNIVLAHNPLYFDSYTNWNPDLVLSGHLHGGLVRLPFLGGVIAPNLQVLPKYDGGHFVKKDSNMIVSRGLGFHSIEFRMWNRSEMVVISLEPVKE